MKKLRREYWKSFQSITLWSEVCKWICMWWYLWRCCWEGWESLTLQLLVINSIRHAPNNSLYERYWKRSKCWMTDTAIPITLHLYIHRKCSEEEEVRVWWRHLFYHCDWANEYCNLERKMKQYMISRSAHRRTVQAQEDGGQEMTMVALMKWACYIILYKNIIFIPFHVILLLHPSAVMISQNFGEIRRRTDSQECFTQGML